ncbi:NUDIX domain-containing protein [Thermoproteota archaeon]
MAEEFIYHVDENNEVISKISRSEVRKKNLTHRGTRIFVFNSKGEILITKRKMTKDLYPGLLELGPGGTVIFGQTYKENAEEELEQEVGIKDVDLEFLFEMRYTDERFDTFAQVFKCIYDGEIIPQEEEIEEHYFLPVEKVKEMIKDSPSQFMPDNIVFFERYLSTLS